MNWQNTNQNYGVIAILFHWLTAVTVFALFFTGWYMMGLDYYDELYNTLPAWHKSVGILFMGFMALRLVWNILNVKPDPLSGAGTLQNLFASVVHKLMLLVIVAILVTGYLIPTANGEGIDVFGWFTLGALAQVHESQADVAGKLHMYLAYGLIVLAALHAIAALLHHFIYRDRTLKRMIGR